MGSIFWSRDTRQVDGQRQILFHASSKGFEEAEGGGEGGKGEENWGESLRARGVCKRNAKILVICMNVGLMAVSFGSDTKICVLCI